MDQMEKVGSVKWVSMETQDPCCPWVAWETWINASRKASLTVCLENKFTACILEVRHFLQQSLETFRAASSLSHRGAGSGPTLGGSWLIPEFPSAPIHTTLKTAVFASSFHLCFSLSIHLYHLLYVTLLCCKISVVGFILFAHQQLGEVWNTTITMSPPCLDSSWHCCRWGSASLHGAVSVLQPLGRTWIPKIKAFFSSPLLS